MRDIRIIYEDEAVIVVDKPAGMLVIPTPKGETRTLTNLLNRMLDLKGVETNAYPCHRLDRETSGAVIYAKGKKAQRVMMEEFRRRRVKKVYVAFVHGHPERKAATIDLPVEGKEAITKYRVLERRKDFSAVEVEPITGRTNQIRIHFKRIGHPLVGERKFAFAKDYPLKFRRVALHAHRVELTHPLTKRPLSVAAPLPQDMQRLLGVSLEGAS